MGTPIVKIAGIPMGGGASAGWTLVRGVTPHTEVITMTEKMDAFARNNLSAAEVMGYYLDFIPWISGQLAPITVFIATVFVTSRMAAHTEIIAILTSGTSFRRMLVPYFIASLLIAVITFWLNGWIIPQSQ